MVGGSIIGCAFASLKTAFGIEVTVVARGWCRDRSESRGGAHGARPLGAVPRPASRRGRCVELGTWHHQSAVLGRSIQPCTHGTFVNLDDACGRADPISFCACPHCCLKNGWVCVQVHVSCPMSDRPRRFASSAQDLFLAVTPAILDHVVLERTGAHDTGTAGSDSRATPGPFHIPRERSVTSSRIHN
jgi:hypothetical protein